MRGSLLTFVLITAASSRGVAPAPAPVLKDELGKQASEAVERGLKFLAASQEKSGFWSRGDSRGTELAVTALAVRAFLWAGHSPGQGPYGETIEKGVRAVLSKQSPNGLLASDHALEMYYHGIGTLMLAEVVGKARGQLAEDIKKALDRAVPVILKAQRKQKGPFQGGWRYRVAGTDADMSVTGWQVAALRAAKDAGCEVPPEVLEQAVGYIRRCRDPITGAYRYTVSGGATPSCTASALVALVGCGQEIKGLEESRKAAEYIQKNLRPSYHFHYAHYYWVQAARLLGGEIWTASRKQIFETILKAERKSGGWQANDGYGPHYGTAMAILTLAVETPPVSAKKEQAP